MRQLFANNVSTTLSSALATNSTTLIVTSAAGFPIPAANQYFLVTVQSGASIEVIQITGVNGATFTISARGQEGTVAQSFPSGSLCEMRITAGTLANLEAENTQLSALAALVAPVATTVDSYAVQDTLDPSGNPLLLLAAADYAWTPVNYALLGSDSLATMSSTTSFTTTVGGNLLKPVSGTIYLAQPTTGAYAGQVKVVTAMSGTSITVSPPFASVLGGNVNLQVYQYVGSLSQNLAPYQYNGSTGQNILALTGNATLTSTQSGLVVSTPGSPTTVTLPSPSSGLTYTILGSGQTTVVSCSSGALITPDGNQSGTWSFTGWGTGIEVVADGANWRAQPFGNSVALPATTNSGPVTYGQLGQWFGSVVPGQTTQSYAGSGSAPGTVSFGGAPKGFVWISGYYSDSPYGANSQTFGHLLTFNGPSNSASPALGNATTQVFYGSGGTTYTRVNGNGTGWSSWLTIANVQQLQNNSTSLNPTTVNASGNVSGSDATGGQNYLTWNQSVNGSFSPTYSSLTVNGPTTLNNSLQLPTGQPLRFGAVGENTDTVVFQRSNITSNVTKLATIVGDDGSGSALPQPAPANGITDYFTIESTNVGIHHLFGTDGTYTAAGPINSYGTVSGANAGGGQNYLTWSQSTNGSFSPTYASLTASNVSVSGTLSASAVTLPAGGAVSLGGGAAVYSDPNQGDVVLRSYNGSAYQYLIFYSSGSVTIGGNINSSSITTGNITTTGSTYYNNNIAFFAKDASGNFHNCFSPLDSSNCVTLVNGAANHVRVVNQAYSAELWYCDNAGNTWSAGNVTAYSDERVKKDWTPLPKDTLEKVALLEKSGVYTRTDGDWDGVKQVGVGAQSLEKILPEAVLVDREGNYSINYGSAALVLCVELARKVLELEAKLQELSK